MNKNELKKRFVIGSANFSQIYGADPIKIDKLEIKKILSFSKKNNINKIDTAFGYFKNDNIFKNIDKDLEAAVNPS